MKKTFLYIACILLVVNAGKSFWDLLNIDQIPDFSSSSNSFAFKLGFILGMAAEIIIYLGLVKIIYDSFLKKNQTNSI